MRWVRRYFYSFLKADTAGRNRLLIELRVCFSLCFQLPSNRQKSKSLKENRKKNALKFGGNKIITYLCTIKTNDMPTVFNLFGYRFWFYGNDHTPIHIHVKKGGAVAKYNIMPISLVYNYGFKPSELKMIEAILEDNEEIIAQHWNIFFNNAK